MVTSSNIFLSPTSSLTPKDIPFSMIEDSVTRKYSHSRSWGWRLMALCLGKWSIHYQNYSMLIFCCLFHAAADMTPFRWVTWAQPSANMWRANGFSQSSKTTNQSTKRARPELNLRLDGVQSCHVHLEQPILPVDSGDPAVVDAPRYVTELFPIFPKAVVLVVHAECTRCPELQVDTWQSS